MLNTGYILDGKYEIISILGNGGMGTVYLCRNNRLGNLWAIKEVLSEWKNKIDFLAEPNILKNLSHPGIPRIIDIFYENDNLYMVEDYIEGKNLKELIEKNGNFPSDKIMNIGLQLCNILEYLHSFSPPIIYRDLKPSNIMLKNDGNIVLVDFGIARTYKENNDSDTILFGSMGYMAPEQLNNIQSNIQTDIYSLGATLYFLATDKTLFPSEETQVTEITLQDLDLNLKQVINKATAINPENRFKTIVEFKSMLSEIDEDYTKTKFIPVDIAKNNTILKTQFMPSMKSERKRSNKKMFYLLAGILLFISVLVALYFLLPHNNTKKEVSDVDNKKIENSQIKNGSDLQKEQVDKDIITRGVLYKDNPIILNDASTNKGKGKDKNKGKENLNSFHILFNLSPAASMSNSKIKATLNSIEVIDSFSIVDLIVDNKTNNNLNIDLTKTFLLNGNGAAFNLSSLSSNNISVPQNTTQSIKFYFNNFDFIGNSYCFKTNINYGTSKDLSLFIDIK